MSRHPVIVNGRMVEQVDEYNNLGQTQTEFPYWGGLRQSRWYGPAKPTYRSVSVDHTANPSESDTKYEDNIKRKILDASLEFVPKEGWSIKALSLGAESVEYPGIAHGLFPNGGADLINFFNLKCNTELVRLMNQWNDQKSETLTNPIDFIRDSMVARLQMLEPYRETWPSAIAIQSLPTNVPAALAALLALADDICYSGGDRSVDINWYIRRIGVAGIYKASELYYLADKSENRTATKNFVTARLQEAQMLQGAIGLSGGSSQAPQTLQSAFVTARNMMGLNWNR